MSARRALVVGGSLGGLFTANLLRSIGWTVDVFEGVGKDLASRGAGIATHAELMAVTRRLGITVDETIGIAVTSKICLDREGRVVHRVPADRIMSSWARFYHPLRELFPSAHYHHGVAATGVEQDADGVTLRLADGSRVRGDLLVAADGVRSTIRQCLLPQVQPRYAGYVAWRAQLPEAMVPRDVYDDIWAHQVFCLPEGEMMLSHPMPGADDDVRPGHRRYNFVWYHPVDGERGLPDLCTDASGRCHGTSIPHPLIRPEVVDAIRRTAHELLAPQIARTFALAPQCFFQAITDLESPRLHFGRIVLLGDAAFVARPHVGMGVAKAALDAQCLADELLAAGHDLEVALPRYEAARLEFGRRAVARARWLGAHLEAQNTPRALRREADLHQDPKVVMVEVGKQIREIPELAELAR
jgi:2-polyprenyl-6-methoxyphenol hydroxylase-like FAD-dependent oxidoreductase